MSCLLEKYGVIPKKCFPESHSSEASRRMNDILNHKAPLIQFLLFVHIPANRLIGESMLTVSLCVTAERILPTAEEHGGQ